MHVACRRGTLACAIAALWRTAGADANAQQTEALPEPLRVEVTGSHIARIDGERALPVQIIRREEIERGNWTTAAELMSHVSANFGQMNNALSAGSLDTPTNVGLSSADLRGIGGGLTLVLLNGRRLSNYAFLSGTVDLGKIPLAAIDRVEILKDGASSIYGTDAIAGVVNFITRKDYAGIAVTGQAGFTEHGGGDHYQATITAGWGNLAKDKFNAFITFDWQQDTALVAVDRAFAATGYLPDEGITAVTRTTFPANIRKPGGAFVNPVRTTGCQPPGAIAVPERPNECVYDEAAQADLLPGQEQWNAIGRATWEWAAGQQLFAEIVYSRNELDLGHSPTPAQRNTTNQVPVIYPAGGPHYPTEFANANGLSGPIEVYLRTTALGRRISTVDSEGQRLMLGGQGTVAGWDYDAAYTYSVNTATYGLSSGYVTTPGLMSAMSTGLVNPFGPSGAVGVDLLNAAQYSGTVRDAKGTLNQVDLNVSRALAQLPGGPLAVAFGGEFRREALTDKPSPLLADQQVVGVNFEINPQDASRTVGAAFAEVNVPVVRGLEAAASVRFDNYSDFGTTTNPKLSVRWQAVPSLLLRGSWGTGFHAPTLPQLFTPVSSTYVANRPFMDPERCPITGANSDCFVEYFYVMGGSESLVPETSTQFGAGAIWEPLPGLSLGLDWWRIDVSNLIGNYLPNDIVQNFDRLSSTNVVRGAPLPGQPGLPGPIVALIGTNENLASLVTSGLDVTITARHTDPAAGTFRFSLTGTYVHVFDVTPDGGTTGSIVGTDAGLGPVPRWRHYAELNWQRGPWGASLAQLFQTGYVDFNATTAPPRNVGTYSLWNTQGTYAGFRNWSIAAGIRNLFDRDPPFSNQPFTAQVGYDPYSADPRGRTFYARVSYAFK